LAKAAAPTVAERYLVPASLADFEFLHFYSTATYSTLTDRAETQVLWNTVVPQLAFQHDFLLHSLLGVAALHAASNQPNKRTQHMDAALEHYNHALPLYRSGISQISSTNCSALFACSSLVVVFAFGFALLREPCGGGLKAPIEEISSIFLLLRGAHTVLREAWHYIEAGEFGIMFRGRFVDGSTVMSPELSASLDQLEAHNHPPWTEACSKDVYEVAIEKLRQCFIGIWEQEDKAFVLSWPMMVESSYIKLLSEQRPMALAILAHYAVALDVVKERWWSTGWGEQLLSDISLSLTGEWQTLISWPLQAVKERNSPFCS
jgi:hypothetical protein